MASLRAVVGASLALFSFAVVHPVTAQTIIKRFTVSEATPPA